MVSIRLWMDSHRIISTRRRILLAENDLCKSLEEGRGPKTTGEFAAALADNLAERMSQIIADIDEQVDNMEEEILTVKSHLLRTQMARARREAISLRRYLAPQREALSKLVNERASWLTELDRLKLREIADRTTRYIEDLDAARERAAVIQEELLSRLSEQMNKRMFVLSIVAAIFLPLGFLTGLLGINVGGIPGADYEGSFYIFTVFLVIVVAIQTWFFRKKRWI
jgi:zinc transporter